VTACPATDRTIEAVADAPHRVLVVDDHVLLGEMIAIELRRAGLVVVVAARPDRSSVLGEAERIAPDVVLLDLDLGDGHPSVELIGPLAAAGSRVLIMSGTTDRAVLASCVEAGAHGIVGKAQPLEALVGAVVRSLHQEPVLTDHDRHELLATLHSHRAAERVRLAPFVRLSARERVVLAELMDGHSAEAIAERSYVSLATVRSQIKAILQKLEVSSQLAAVAAARRAGWSPDEQLPRR
jgi:two-component system, NarL family, nitrate/nitrite response regulator NarL